MKSDVVFSRQSDEWETPQGLFDSLDEEFNFVFDAAATDKNSKCPVSSSDSLPLDWHKVAGRSAIWLNPPYSRIKDFMQKAYEESLKGVTVVCLIPSRTDTKYWHDYVMRADEIRFIKGRLKFVGAESGAPFPSSIVIFNKRKIPGGWFNPSVRSMIRRGDA